MQSFRTELENPIVEKEIIELERKIRLYRNGALHGDKFKSLRLARGIYGQRQPGVQMVRIKLPFGRVTCQQLLKIADISDEYATGNLHLTTRQDIQIHYVNLDRTPELWARLAEDDITLREACGNTVRNVTASPTAGIDPREPFDVSPYAREVFEYLVRNPICQEMGRKFKIAFSSSDQDSAFAYIHDIGFVPKVRTDDGAEHRGFKVVIGGGLGAQPRVAQKTHDFLPEDQVIPYIESVIRVFDRIGERNNRNKARFKFVVQKLGLNAISDLIEKEWPAIKVKSYTIDRQKLPSVTSPPQIALPPTEWAKPMDFERWKKTNVSAQKQPGFFSVSVKITTGDISTEKARYLINTLRPYIADDIRITPNQGLLFKYVRLEALPLIYQVLTAVDLAHPGFDSVADITTCPGTDTCNLGISNSTEMARVLESILVAEYPDLIFNRDIKIKISGCMNSCGQHSLAHIGLHGSSLKVGKAVIPAAQVMLGGASLGNGAGRVAERVIKIPSKRVPAALRLLLDDFSQQAHVGMLYHEYYEQQTKDYFYNLLKPLADLTSLTEAEFIDWGQQAAFQTAIGIGECAGVVIDLVATLLYETEEKQQWAQDSLEGGAWADAVYHAYSVFVNGAKALLLSRGIQASSQQAIIKAFDEQWPEAEDKHGNASFAHCVMQINRNEPTPAFARRYVAQASAFVNRVSAYRLKEEGSSANKAI